MPWLGTVWDRFQDRCRDDRLAHALLLQGPEGTGKTELAQHMLAALLCNQPSDGGACGTCRSCRLLGGGAHPDAFVITRLEDSRTGKVKKEILVEQIRDLIGSMGLTTTISQRKVALIMPADAMNRNAANALLKTLEEPPGDAVLILLSHEPSRLPVTIRSRCQEMTTQMPEISSAVDWLVGARGLDEASARVALRAAGGSPVRALRYHEAGLVSLHGDLEAALEQMYSGSDGISAFMGMVEETEPDTLWRWLSEACAGRSRSASRNGMQQSLLLRLQQQADRCRRLSNTPVRGDLLLREWLIEWCRAGATARS